MFKLVVILVIFQLAYMNCSPVYEDSEAAASDHHHEHGRVQIKVFRGPTEHSGHDYFAPWGYWVKQPADADHHH